MNKRNIGLLLLVVVCAIVVGLLVYYLIFYNFGKPKEVQTMAPVVTTPVATLITNTPDVAKTAVDTTDQSAVFSEDDVVEQDAGQVAKIFVERFGTYSNQAGPEQFSDLKLFVTSKMQTWVDGQAVKIISAQTDYKTAHIVNTQAVSTKILTLNKTAGTASVVINARRTDKTGDEAPKISNPEIKLEVLKVGKRWLVDSVVWQ